MREIKFRAWDKKQKWFDDEMFLKLEGSLFDYADARYNTPNTEIERVNPDRYTLEQYTGLKDKNGKEIYEGDIVYGCWYSHEEPIDDTMGVVTYFEGWCAFVIWNEENTIHSELNGQGAYIHTFEVLGNIHQNPELLKGE